MKFEVLQEGLKDEAVWLWGQEGREIVLGAITREALEDDADPPQRDLTPGDLVLLATANAEAISRVLSTKLEAGEATIPRAGDRPRVVLRSGDLRAAREALSASVLDVKFRWG